MSPNLLDTIPPEGYSPHQQNKPACPTLYRSIPIPAPSRVFSSQHASHDRISPRASSTPVEQPHQLPKMEEAMKQHFFHHGKPDVSSRYPLNLSHHVPLIDHSPRLTPQKPKNATGARFVVSKPTRNFPSPSSTKPKETNARKS